MSSRSITRFIPITIITIITITTTIIIISRCLVQSRTRAPYFRTTSTDARRILANARASRECTRRGFPGDFGKFDRRRIFMRACCVKRALISPGVFAAICKERSVNNEFSAVPPPPSLSLSLSLSDGRFHFAECRAPGREVDRTKRQIHRFFHLSMSNSRLFIAGCADREDYNF